MVIKMLYDTNSKYGTKMLVKLKKCWNVKQISIDSSLAYLIPTNYAHIIIQTQNMHKIEEDYICK